MQGEHKDKTKHGEKKKLDEDPPDKSPSDDDPWAGLSYRIDDETGKLEITLQGIKNRQFLWDNGVSLTNGLGRIRHLSQIA